MRLLCWVLAWLLAAQPAFAVCGANEQAHIDINSINDSTVTLPSFTIGGARRILAIPINWKSSSYASVTGVAGAGLTWTRRGAPHQMDSTTCFGVGSPCFVDVEVWSADATSAFSAQQIVATWTAGVLVGAMAVIAFQDIIGGFDPNSSLPAVAMNPSGAAAAPTVSGVSTTAPTGLILAICEYNTSPGSVCIPPTGYTAIGSASNYQPFNGRYMQVSISQLLVGSAQSSLSLVATGIDVASWMMIGDSLVCSAIPVPPTVTKHPWVQLRE